jgi:(p)ppGpp synthase/HD superfamily hydrolase
MEKENLAYQIACRAFVAKKDKGGKPYIEHLKFVKNNAEKYYEKNQTEYLNCVAILHDLIEDCPEWKHTHIQAIFETPAITDAIYLLTKSSNMPYEEYISNIKPNALARAVKLADLEHNMNLTRLKEITDKDLERVKKYHKAYNFLLK